MYKGIKLESDQVPNSSLEGAVQQRCWVARRNGDAISGCVAPPRVAARTGAQSEHHAEKKRQRLTSRTATQVGVGGDRVGEGQCPSTLREGEGSSDSDLSAFAETVSAPPLRASQPFCASDAHPCLVIRSCRPQHAVKLCAGDMLRGASDTGNRRAISARSRANSRLRPLSPTRWQRDPPSPPAVFPRPRRLGTATRPSPRLPPSRRPNAIQVVALAGGRVWRPLLPFQQVRTPSYG
eukprot:364494-Chlamydomonas_euryale.AAC.8